MIVAGHGTPQYGQRFVDIKALVSVAGDGCAGRVRLLNKVVTVVDVDAGAAGRGFVDSSSEGIVFEAI
jgi:hypothetical protein